MEPQQVIRTIVIASDWQEVLSNLIIEHGLDPANVDIIALTDAFMNYLRSLQDWDFRIPGRFVLVAAILLSMKCNVLFETHEDEKQSASSDTRPQLTAPPLDHPVLRQPSRKVSLTELIAALNTALEMKTKKSTTRRMVPQRPMIAINEPENIEAKLTSIYERVKSAGLVAFSDLVPVWRRQAIIGVFLPLLYLMQRGKVICEQDEPFKEIFVKLA
jgi:segregation and condensation protein A